MRRGLYAVIPPGADPDFFPVDPFLVAAKLSPDAVLSHHTALEFHGKAYSVHALLTKALLRLGEEHYGVSMAERSGLLN